MKTYSYLFLILTTLFVVSPSSKAAPTYREDFYRQTHRPYRDATLAKAAWHSLCIRFGIAS